MSSTSAAAPKAGTAELIGWRMQSLGLWAQIPGAAADPASAQAAGATSPGATGPGTTGPERIAAVAEHLLALQGQDWNASRWALGLRAPGTTDADVQAAFESALIVRSWPMRGTIHVVPAADIGWMQALTNHRVLPGAAKRRAFIGLDDETLARMTDVALAALAGGHSLSRDELAERWIEAGIEVQGAWRYHVVWWLCQNGLLTQGPAPAGEPRLVLAEEWITAPRTLEGEEALAELAARFVRGRGPATEKDLCWWTGLTVRDARRGIAAAAGAGAIAAVEIEGVAHWAEPRLIETAPERPARSALLLPGFDEHLLGYTDRGAVLDAEHFERIVPGRNGMFRATVVEDGRVTGVWTKQPRAKATRITVEPFPGRKISAAKLKPATAAWSAFHGTPAEVQVGA